MNQLYLLSCCIGLGENYDMDQLVSYLNDRGINTVHIGMQDMNFEKAMNAADVPRLIGIQFSLFHPEWNAEAFAYLDACYPRTPFCLLLPAECIDEKWATSRFGKPDFIIRGKPEVILHDLFVCLQKNQSYTQVPGISYLCRGRYIQNPASYPAIPFHDLPPANRADLMRKNLRHAVIRMSLGCADHCSFCIERQTGLDFRSPVQVVDELEYLYRKHKIHGIHFLDNNFGSDMTLQRLKQLSNILLERKLDFYYTANFDPQFILDVDEKYIEHLLASGLYGVYLTLEAGNKSDLELYGKLTERENSIKAYHQWKKVNVFTNIYFINFNPFSTLHSIKENLQFLYCINQCTLTNICSRYELIPGTPLYFLTKRQGLVMNRQAQAAYRFSDSRLEPLCSFLYGYHSRLTQYDRYQTDLNDMLGYLYRYCKNHELREPAEIVYDYSTRVESICNELSRSLAGLMERLIGWAENGWDISQANDWAESYYSEEKVTKANETLKSLTMRMYYKLFQCPKETGRMLRRFIQESIKT